MSALLFIPATMFFVSGFVILGFAIYDGLLDLWERFGAYACGLIFWIVAGAFVYSAVVL